MKNSRVIEARVDIRDLAVIAHYLIEKGEVSLKSRDNCERVC